MPIAKKINQMVLFSSFVITRFLESYVEILKQDGIVGLILFENVQGISGHNKRLVSPVLNYLDVLSSATKKVWEDTLQIMVEIGPFLWCHIFYKAIIHVVMYSSTNSWI